MIKNPGYWVQQSRLNSDIISVECVKFYSFSMWFIQPKKGNIKLVWLNIPLAS